MIVIEALLGVIVVICTGGIAGAAQSGNQDGFVKLLTALVLALGFIGLLLK